MANLTRTLGFGDVTFFVVGSVIGSGIFLTPGAVIHDVGGKIGPALLVWLSGGVLSLLGALTYAELTAMKPEAGGLYVFIRDCFGRFPAYLFGWTLFFVIASGSVATLAVAFSRYLGNVVPLTPVMGKVVAVAMIAVVGALNIWGTRKSADVTNISTFVKVGAIIAMSAALLYLGHGFAGSTDSLWPAQVDGSLASGFGVAMIAVLWAYEGWQYCTYTASETINPRRTIPLALLVGSLILIGVYMLANLGYLAALGPEQAAASESIAAVSVGYILNPFYGKLVALVILVSIFSAANTTLLGAPRVFYAMAADGVFFKRLADVHREFHTPAVSIFVSSVWAAILAATGSFEQLFTYVVFIGWIFYALAAATIFVYRRREPDEYRPYRVPGYPVTPLIFILAAVALVANTVIADPWDSAKGIAVVLAGAPIYLIWQYRLKKQALNGNYN
jgi:APA family basic amino acid/polyamine antiporter